MLLLKQGTGQYWLGIHHNTPLLRILFYNALFLIRLEALLVLLLMFAFFCTWPLLPVLALILLCLVKRNFTDTIEAGVQVLREFSL